MARHSAQCAETKGISGPGRTSPAPAILALARALAEIAVEDENTRGFLTVALSPRSGKREKA